MAEGQDFGRICVNCNIEFELLQSRKSLRRTGLESNIKHHGVSPLTVLSTTFPGTSLSPSGKFLCEKCTQLLGKINTGKANVKKAADQFLEATKPESYLKRKLRPPRTPAKFSSTPVRKRFRKDTPIKPLHVNKKVDLF